MSFIHAANFPSGIDPDHQFSRPYHIPVRVYLHSHEYGVFGEMDGRPDIAAGLRYASRAIGFASPENADFMLVFVRGVKSGDKREKGADVVAYKWNDPTAVIYSIRSSGPHEVSGGLSMRYPDFEDFVIARALEAVHRRRSPSMDHYLQFPPRLPDALLDLKPPADDGASPVFA